jgi:O-6-methylguanine DNA methyltransferase
MKNKFDKQKLYDLLTQIPRGRVATYGSIAEKLGNKAWARAVGNALHRNPDGEKYPCYKVVSSSGRLSEAYAFGGVDEQARYLASDGVEVREYRVDLQIYLHTFD